MPEAGSPRHAREPGLLGMRAWRVDGFPELQIFYRVTDRAIEIAHLWHAKRDLRSLEGEGES